MARVFDGVGCAGYFFNESSEEKIPALCEAPSRRLAERNAAQDESATMFFDGEGTLTGDTVIIGQGVLKRGMCDALSAARLKNVSVAGAGE